MVPGWRVGWMRFSRPEKMKDLISAITRLASGRLCSSTPAQYAVLPALTGGTDCIEAFLVDIKTRRDRALAHVRSIEGLSSSVPDAAFYMMIRVSDSNHSSDEEFVLKLLNETGVLVVTGSGFGCDPADGYFRLVYLADEATFDAAFNRIGRFING
jgi:aspartate/methionine/tyrosine aminotransferase